MINTKYGVSILFLAYLNTNKERKKKTMDIRSTNPKLFLVEKARVKRKIDKKERY